MPIPLLSNAELDQIQAEYPDVYRPGHCPTCHDTGTLRFKGVDMACDCNTQRRLLLQYLNAGIGLTYQRLLWSDLAIPGETILQTMDYVDNHEKYLDHGMGLFVWGTVGTGKTMLGNLVLKELVKKGVDCYATTFSQTVESFTAGWNDAGAKARFARRFMQSKVLLLDDLGKEFRRSNQLHSTTFDYILRTRVQNNRATILTTNMNAAELRVGYGSSILSLLVEKSIEIPLTGEDYRPKAHERAMAEVAAGEVAPIT